MMPTDKTITIDGAVWMTVGGENFGGKDRIALLAKIDECGSITQAAKAINMSYKAAWDAIDKMNNLAGEALVERLTGGKGGGGTRLTRRGVQLIDNFNRIERAHHEFVARLSGQATGIADDFLLIRNMSMKTSARNQLHGQVSRLVHGAVNDEIELVVAGGQKIIAIITHESTTALGLQVGAHAFALINASSIIVVADAAGARFSARNSLAGTVARIIPGAVNTEVVIALQDGGTIASVITNESVHSLNLTVGHPASALFKATSVILAIAG